MQKITPCLWFDKNAEEAANFYLNVFKEGNILSKTYYPDTGKEIHGMEAGTLLTIYFEIKGFSFCGLNGGPVFKLNPSVSFTVNCQSANEVNEIFEKLSDGGKVLMELNSYPFSERYGWVEDRFGVSWQVIKPQTERDEKIVPSLMFTQDKAGKASEAMDFYVSVFKNSKRGEVYKYGSEQTGENPENIMYGEFIIEDQKFSAMDSSGPHAFTFNEAASLMIECGDQKEIDYYWEKLSSDPKAEQCGWLKDKFGLAWQVIPKGMDEMMNGDPETAKRKMDAFLHMKKIDIEDLKNA